MIVLEILRKEKLYMEYNKCEFWLKSSFFGYIFFEDEISVDPNKILVVKDWPILQKILKVRRFLILLLLSKFVQDFFKIAWPLTKLLRKGEKYDRTTKYDLAFEELKRRLTIAQLLAILDGSCVQWCIWQRTRLCVDTSW